MKIFMLLTVSIACLVSVALSTGVIGSDRGGHSGTFHFNSEEETNSRKLSNGCIHSSCNGFGTRNSWTTNVPCTDVLKDETCSIASTRAQTEANSACSADGSCSCVGTLTEQRCEAVLDGDYCRYYAHYTFNGACQSNQTASPTTSPTASPTASPTDPPTPAPTPAPQCDASTCIGYGTNNTETMVACSNSTLEETCASADTLAMDDTSGECSSPSGLTCGCTNGTTTRKLCEYIEVSNTNSTKCVYLATSVYMGTCGSD